jgi:hypothetical protein
MSLNAILERHAPAEGEPEGDNVNTLTALVGRSQAMRKGLARPMLFLDIEASDGDRYGLPYALMLGVVLRRGGEQVFLEITFTSHLVRVFGRNLHEVYPLVLTNVLGFLEASPGVEPEKAAFWIDRIEVNPAEGSGI